MKLTCMLPSCAVGWLNEGTPGREECEGTVFSTYQIKLRVKHLYKLGRTMHVCDIVSDLAPVHSQGCATWTQRSQVI